MDIKEINVNLKNWLESSHDNNYLSTVVNTACKLRFSCHIVS